MRFTAAVDVFAFLKTLLVLAILGLLVPSASAQGPIGNETWTFDIYHTNFATYPFVHAYIRTFDQSREPLANLNYANIRLMVKGVAYEPLTIGHPQTGQQQYSVETIENRNEAFRTVMVLDCSQSMAGRPFADATSALEKFIEVKRPQDQVAIVAVRDTPQGYQIVSTFQKDATMLRQRLADVRCDGKVTRLYDSIAAALEMCATASQGGINAAEGDYVILNSVIVLSDGKDEGSALKREELISSMNRLKVPIPIYSLAYSKESPEHFKNLEALSRATFGRYWVVPEAQEFARTIQQIHRINRSDYVVTFRSYVPVNGEKHSYKVGVEYPSNSGKVNLRDGQFEALDSKPLLQHARFKELMTKLEAKYPALPGGPSEKPSAVAAVSSVPLPPQRASDDNFWKVLALGGVGAAILLLLLAIVLWVKRGGPVNAYRVDTRARGSSVPPPYGTSSRSSTTSPSTAIDDKR
jgi:Mg-chelatase subunit ChlD